MVYYLLNQPFIEYAIYINFFFLQEYNKLHTLFIE